MLGVKAIIRETGTWVEEMDSDSFRIVFFCFEPAASTS